MAAGHQGQTNQVKKVQLPSSIEHIGWTKPMAALSGKAGLEIFTHYVGNGSDLEIEISDQSGKSLGKYKEKISGNRFWAQIKVPADAKQALYATVKLPKHGLQMKSDPLIILPLVEITNAKWDRKEVQEGDLVKLSTDVKVVPDGTEGEIEIWEYDSDGAHDFVTKFPVLVKSNKVETEWEYHEDSDDIPTAEEAEESYKPPEYFFRLRVREVYADSGLLKFKRHVGEMLEMEDVLFHFDSAVMMPDYDAEQPGRDDSAPYRISGLAVLRACYLYVDKKPNVKLLITGHTDTTGPQSYNFRLSKLRAENVLHALMGEKEKWIQISLNHSQVKDYQQILKWIKRGWGWNCDPGLIDNILGPITKRAVRSFQGAYNKHFKASISVDGVVGKETWGAFFQVYMEELAQMMETDQAGLARLRSKLHALNEAHKAVGCGENFPILNEQRNRSSADHPLGSEKGKKAAVKYRSKLSRRVELLFFEPEHEPTLNCPSGSGTCVPEDCVINPMLVYRFKHLVVGPVPHLMWLHLQTVDDFGFRVPDTELVLRPEYGKEVRVRTDKDGYWSGRIRADGLIPVFLSDGKTPAYFAGHLSDESEEPPGGDTGEKEEKPAVIDPGLAATTITDLVVPAGISDEEIKRRQTLVQRFGRVPQTGYKTRRGGNRGRFEREPAGNMSQRGLQPREEKGEMPRLYRRSYGNYIADNLFIAAGWKDGSLNLEEFFKLLPNWLELYHPSAVKNVMGYHVQVLAGNTLFVISSDGEKKLGQFTISAEWIPKGRIGLYTPFQCFKWVYRDMYTQTSDFWMQKGGDQDSTAQKGDQATKSDSLKPETPEEDTVQLDQTLVEADQERFQELILGQLSGEVQVLYRPPPPGVDTWLARHGGTGLLENYPGQQFNRKQRDQVHARNLAVVKHCKLAYEAYIQKYIEDVKKTKTESELKALGPPDSHFGFPEPVGITETELRELRSEGVTTKDFSAWRAIVTHLCEMYGVHGDGDMWLKLEFEVGTGSQLGKIADVRVKWNFETTAEGHIKKTSTEGAASLSAQVKIKGIDYKLGGADYFNPKTGAQEYKVNFQAGQYAFEINATTGEIKAGVGPLFLRLKEQVKQIGFGAQLSLRDLLKLRRENQLAEGIPADKCINPDNYPDVKMAIGIMAQLLEEATVMAFLMGTRGFFERRPVEELRLADWASLDTDERAYLTELRWAEPIEKDPNLKPMLKLYPKSTPIWDVKKIIPYELYPETTRTFWTKLTYGQKKASLNLLGALWACEANWFKFWRSFAPKVAS
jgi:peptidoglycan hydrolase-like protein with peptidoglycan-binding domain